MTEQILTEDIARLMMNRDYDTGEVWCSWEEESKEAEITRKSYRITAAQILDITDAYYKEKYAGYKSPQECEACKEATNAVRKVYESLIPGKFDLVIQKPPTGLPQVGQFTPEEYVPILGYIPPEPWELTGFDGRLYWDKQGRKTILEDVRLTRKAKADWLALPLERKVGLE